MDFEALNNQLADTARAVASVLDGLLIETDGHENRVVEAMRYAALGGGKCIRPFLLCASASLFEVDQRRALQAAAALEMVHCYSLVHDDLPAMDNDDLRRGRATCHIKFDEATAILAGDALLTRAFEVLSDENTHPDPSIRSKLVSVLARAAGSSGMVGGQMIDLYAEKRQVGLTEIRRLQRMKTGALIAVSCEMGAIMGEASDEEKKMLAKYSKNIGLAFQIADDLLDATGDEREVGKKVQKDEDAGKATFISLLGVDEARRQADSLINQAQKHISSFGENAEPLKNLAKFIINRRS